MYSQTIHTNYKLWQFRILYVYSGYKKKQIITVLTKKILY